MEPRIERRGSRVMLPYIRNTRVMVYDVLMRLSALMTADEIIAELPEINKTDIAACLPYRGNHEAIMTGLMVPLINRSTTALKVMYKKKTSLRKERIALVKMYTSIDGSIKYGREVDAVDIEEHGIDLCSVVDELIEKAEKYTGHELIIDKAVAGDYAVRRLEKTLGEMRKKPE